MRSKYNNFLPFPISKEQKKRIEEQERKIKDIFLNNKFTKWKSFKLEHLKEIQDKAYEKIDKKINKKNGVYIYENEKRKILYVGKGKPLSKRMKTHYENSYGTPHKKGKKWYKFWSSHLGKMKIYWKEVEDEDVRKIIEMMLHYVLEPEFDSGRKNFEESKKSKN